MSTVEKNITSSLMELVSRQPNISTFNLEEKLLLEGDSYVTRGKLLEASSCYARAIGLEGKDISRPRLQKLASAILQFHLGNDDDPELEGKETSLSKSVSTFDSHLESFKSCPLFCSACEGVFVDPVTDMCGRTYCRSCLEEDEGKHLPTFDDLKANIVMTKIMEIFSRVDEFLKLKMEVYKFYRSGYYEKALSAIDRGLSNDISPDIFVMLIRCKCCLTLGRHKDAMNDAEAVLKYTQSHLMKAQVTWVIDQVRDSISSYLNRFVLHSLYANQSEVSMDFHQVVQDLLQQRGGSLQDGMVSPTPPKTTSSTMSSPLSSSSSSSSSPLSSSSSPLSSSLSSPLSSSSSSSFLSEVSLKKIDESQETKASKWEFCRRAGIKYRRPHTRKRKQIICLNGRGRITPGGRTTPHSRLTPGGPITPGGHVGLERRKSCSMKCDSLRVLCKSGRFATTLPRFPSATTCNLFIPSETPPTARKIHGTPMRIFLKDPQSFISKVSKLLKVEDLECPLCFKIFLDPVTTPCGHTFCLECMYRSFDHAPSCPLCKENLHSYMRSRTLSSTEALDWLLLNFFPEETQGRKRSQLLEQTTMECISKGENVPIFVCTVAFPSVTCPLHVFEPRYKLMIRRCLDSDSKQFGMCGVLANDNENEFASFGTMLEIRSVKFSHDGRSILHTIGRRRFQVVGRSIKDGYYEARVEYVSDVAIGEDDVFETMELMRHVYNKCHVWFSSLCEERMRRILLHYGPFPTLETPDPPSKPPPIHIMSTGCPYLENKECPVVHGSRFFKYDAMGDSGASEIEERDFREPPKFFPSDGPGWMWYLTAILPVGEDVKASLLSSSCVKHRLKHLDTIVDVALKNDTWKT